MQPVCVKALVQEGTWQILRKERGAVGWNGAWDGDQPKGKEARVGVGQTTWGPGRGEAAGWANKLTGLDVS